MTSHLICTSAVAQTTESPCPKCGSNNKGVRSCCGKGGSWRGKCGQAGSGKQYTWDEGRIVCGTKDAVTTATTTTTIVLTEAIVTTNTMPINGGCDSKRTCTNTPGGRTCGDCPFGWMNDGDTGCKGLCYVKMIFFRVKEFITILTIIA